MKFSLKIDPATGQQYVAVSHRGKALLFDFAYQYLHQSDRAGRTTNCGQEAPTVACNNGQYTFHGNLIGATLALKF